MPSLKEVKTRIGSVQSTQQITNAMKLVAAAKLRRAQDAITQIRPYSEKMQQMLANVIQSLDGDGAIENVYSRQGSKDKILLVPMTSDRGLCGSFNSNVIKATVNQIEANYLEQKRQGNLLIMPLGKRGADYFIRHEYQVLQEQIDVFTNLSFMRVREASNRAVEMFTNEQVDEVVLIYNSFKNVATQMVVAERFLPIVPEEMAEKTGSAAELDYIFEPRVEFLIEDLIPKSLNIQFYKAVLDSNASEHGARMTAMDKATENAGELLKELKLMYNRSRQAAITKEILEIVGGANALQNN